MSSPVFHTVSDVPIQPVIAIFSFRATPETDDAPASTSHLPTSNPVPSTSGSSQQPPAPTIHSYLLPHSQGVQQTSSPGKPYVPSKSIQKLTQYPSGGAPDGTGVNGISGGSTNQYSSPVIDGLLDDDINGANERWSDRFSFVAKDSYGNLRCAFPSSILSVRSR